MEQVLWNQDTCTYVHTLLLKIMYQVDTYVRMCCFLHMVLYLSLLPPPPHTHTCVHACIHSEMYKSVCLRVQCVGSTCLVSFNLVSVLVHPLHPTCLRCPQYPAGSVTWDSWLCEGQWNPLPLCCSWGQEQTVDAVSAWIS